MSLKQFGKELNGKGVEGELIKTIVSSLIVSLILIGVLYYFNPASFNKYGFFLFFAALSYATIVPSIRQVRAYKHFNCMSGMMIGMTIGMIAGFMGGYYIGATNGMFVGGMFGMIIGVTLGIWMGSCCGVMGFMEGTMAGLMGGWMGAMTSVMLLNDHLKLATVFIFIVSAVIMFGLNYMIYTETRETERERKEESYITLIITFILMVVTAWLMVSGPRSFLFQ